MHSFDQIFADKVGTIDFSKYVSIRALLAAKNWPRNLVPLDQIAQAFSEEAEMAADWRPDATELKHAPILYAWHFVDHTAKGQGLRLEGICGDHPVLLGMQHITTSHLVAMDLADFKWARTLSRYYRLSMLNPQQK